MHKLRVVQVTNNLETNPDCLADTKEFPNLVSYVEDECAMFVVDTTDGRFWPVNEFFHMVNVMEFLVDSVQLND